MVRHCVRWSRRWKSRSTRNTPVPSVAKTTWNELVLVFGSVVLARRPSPAVLTSTQHPPQLLFVRQSVVYVTCANNRCSHFPCARWTRWKRRKFNKRKITLDKGLWRAWRSSPFILQRAYIVSIERAKSSRWSSRDAISWCRSATVGGDRLEWHQVEITLPAGYWRLCESQCSISDSLMPISRASSTHSKDLLPSVGGE